MPSARRNFTFTGNCLHMLPRVNVTLTYGDSLFAISVQYSKPSTQTLGVYCAENNHVGNST